MAAAKAKFGCRRKGAPTFLHDSRYVLTLSHTQGQDCCANRMEKGSRCKEFRNETGGIGLRTHKSLLAEEGPATNPEENEKCPKRGAHAQGSEDPEDVGEGTFRTGPTEDWALGGQGHSPRAPRKAWGEITGLGNPAQNTEKLRTVEPSAITPGAPLGEGHLGRGPRGD